MRMIELTEIRRLAADMFPEARVSLVHLLIAWAIHDPGGELRELLKGTGISSREMVSALKPLMDDPKNEDYGLVSSCLEQITDGPATGRHLLTAICSDPSHRVSRSLVAAGLDLQALANRLEQQERIAAGCLAKHGIVVDESAMELTKYGRELTEIAREGAFDHLCDRPEEMERILEVLLRKMKCNAVLTGPAGVGKTALAELLARMIARGEVPDVLQNTPVFELSMARLVAGTKYRGEFEERMEKVIQELLKLDSPIVFIDEMHLIWGAGRAEGVITDGANILKPYLARGGFRVIGATTDGEYHSYITPDEALARRFQEIRLEEPDPEMTARMVAKQAKTLERYHGIHVSDAVLRRAIELADRYLPHRRQPDKTIDLLDRSAVAVVRREGREVVETDLLNLLAKDTNGPITELEEDEREWLTRLPDRLKERVVGQDHAVKRVTDTLVFRRQDLGASDRCLGIFLFAGDTGVGKTELARAIAANFYGRETALLCVDLAEYNEAASINKLIGSPPGYIGSDKEGQLMKWLHTHGCGVLLFDEIEKAHPDVRLLLLGLLDNGCITSAKGETVDARQCVVVLTTNAVTAKDMNRSAIGFARTSDEMDPAEALSDQFPAEFLGRLDEIILFNRLGTAEMREILRMRLSEAEERLAKKKVRLSYEEDRMLDFLMNRLRSNKSGARGIHRLLEKEVLQPVSLALLNRQGAEPVTLVLGDSFYRAGEVVFAPLLKQATESVPCSEDSREPITVA